MTSKGIVINLVLLVLIIAALTLNAAIVRHSDILKDVTVIVLTRTGLYR